MSEHREDGPSPPQGQGQHAGQHESISIEALADRVYRLLLREIRVESARGNRGPRGAKE